MEETGRNEAAALARKERTETSSPLRRWRAPAIVAALVALVAIVYVQVRSFGFVNFDDGRYVYQNSHVRAGLTLDGIVWALTTVHAANWHPLTWVSLMVDVTLFGVDPGSQHLVNTVLHAANAVLLFAVLVRATGGMWRSSIVAALFAVHPLHVESVAWIAERKDVLSTFFWFAATLAWIEHRRKPTRTRYAATLAAFALGLASKPMLVTLPFTLLLLDVWPLNRIALADLASRKVVPLLREKLPFFALSAASAVVTWLAQARGGATSSDATFPLGVRLGNALVSYGAYLAKAIWPFELVAAYPHPGLPPGGIPVWKVVVGAVLLAGITAAVLWQRRRPYLAVGWLWYLVTLVPVIGIVQVGLQGMADRYTYVPLVGIFFAIVWLGTELAASSPVRRAVLGTSAAGVIAACTWIARAQAAVWRSSFSLFTHALEVDPGNPMAWRNLGTAHYDAHEYPQAVAALRESVRLMPLDAHAWMDLGIAYISVGQTSEAGTCFAKALRMKPADPFIWFNVGIAAAMRGDWAQASEAEDRLRSLSPELADRLARTLRAAQVR